MKKFQLSLTEKQIKSLKGALEICIEMSSQNVENDTLSLLTFRKNLQGINRKLMKLKKAD